MKSSDRKGILARVAIALLAISGVALGRAGLERSSRSVKRGPESLALPSPRVTKALSLGYRAAFADLLLAHVLVSYGQHLQQKRRFELAGVYLDIITTLDPKFREPYRLADTLIIFQARAPRYEDYLLARRLLERGLAQFPYDGELWMQAGQYLAYIASGYVPEQEREAWQLEGARKLARSCELESGATRGSLRCLGAASLLNRVDSHEAAAHFLERVVSISDDPEVQAFASRYFDRNAGDAERARADERARRLWAVWSNDLTFISKEAMLLIGPRFDGAECAGVPAPALERCATSFRDWSELAGAQ